MTNSFKAAEIDRKFDDGEDVREYFDMTHPTYDPGTQASRKVNLTLPGWMIDRLDNEAGNLAVSRNALVNVWLAERIKDEDKDRKLVH
ncbi:MAG: BrnA antitoxin family protein [Bifidobacterium tibiigranuli]|jgi:hypothetical protein|uniref:type II toxin-antitoxin system BrnA family antitoxin n=1 Tax=Bifidobacterium tibiigranuli TaxID=2172043 RepID=UPI0026EDC825|nr:hypothetical protein [Bifidobacterium tibiigranuli]MCI1673443.1 BrnA antitoxin family protein [Bifidobacterium tibiigranuli]MCI1712743.1 BrnA antitoxin family protein [Bifidobacterium tibiigranuli]MCI1834859.1 BrnA antitoxin family protein [Bifidobacterium tibiigranuli]